MFNQQEYIKKWRKENKDKMLKKMKEYRLNNPEKIKKLSRKYYGKNKMKIKEYQLKNKDNILEYKKTHKEQRNKWLRNYLKKPEVKIASNLRRRVNLALNGKLKSGTIIGLLGCDILTLKQHLANKFTEGMSFDNYGTWHIDHIKPCISFDLSKEEEQKECFHYTNLQPLWAHDNLTKPRKRAGDL